MLDPDVLSRLLSRALRNGGEYADVFCERRNLLTYRFQEGRVHESGLSLTQGVGIRVILGEAAGYAFSDDLSIEALLQAADTASNIARNGPSGSARSLSVGAIDVRAPYANPEGDRGDVARYVALIERIDIAARAYDPRVVAVNAQIADEVQEVWIASSDGALVHDRRPLISLGAQVVTLANGERGTGYYADGGRTSLAYFDRVTPETIACEAARVAVLNAEAVAAPAGEMEIVVGAGSGGVLLHEAVGHGLESDFNRRGVSLYSGRVGERVASELVTIFDDGSLSEERGSVAVDDEGVAGQHKVLVENGVLRGYMQDRLNAKLMGVAPTGSGRRQSFRSMPQPRMSNTYMPDGTSDVDEIVRSTRRGIYAKSFGGGQVEISKGDFVFMVSEGYAIENGKIGAPIKNATIVGNGPEAMTKVVAVGNDSRLAPRHYTCGKGGQHVPVGVGMPTVKISAITVGGTQGE
ncbi:MAG TPA: metallopeptidase TldD-related protein [Candidatus Baltobacteraceae bacterium]